jgi:hypothetical protein
MDEEEWDYPGTNRHDGIANAEEMSSFSVTRGSLAPIPIATDFTVDLKMLATPTRTRKCGTTTGTPSLQAPAAARMREASPGRAAGLRDRRVTVTTTFGAI